jgi:hypothetical protein
MNRYSRYLIIDKSLVITARVAQSVERSAVNRKVGGSNPPVSDIFIVRRIINKRIKNLLVSYCTLIALLIIE